MEINIASIPCSTQQYFLLNSKFKEINTYIKADNTPYGRKAICLHYFNRIDLPKFGQMRNLE